MDLNGVGRALIVGGLLMAAIGVLIIFAGHVPLLDRLGRLPGDFVVRRGPVTLYAPLLTSLLLSVLLTIALSLFFRR